MWRGVDGGRRVLPARVREVVGVSHLKVLLFDNDVLMTGANLSDAYFTFRQVVPAAIKSSHPAGCAHHCHGPVLNSHPPQDRYMLLREVPALADWLAALVQCVARFSPRLLPGPALGPCPAGLDPALQAPAWCRAFAAALEALPSPSPRIAGCNTWVAPTLQMGPCHVAHDEAATVDIMAAALPGARLALSSAYLNLAPSYERQLAAAVGRGVSVELMTAAASANGFFGSRVRPVAAAVHVIAVTCC